MVLCCQVHLESWNGQEWQNYFIILKKNSSRKTRPKHANQSTEFPANVHYKVPGGRHTVGLLTIKYSV
jgi:hypothetical protein